MPFCKYCGRELNINETCQCHNPKLSTPEVLPNAPQIPVTPHYNQVPAADSVPSNYQKYKYIQTEHVNGKSLTANLKKLTKMFLSGNPLQVVEAGLNEKENIWILLAGLRIIIAGITFVVVLGKLFDEILGKILNLISGDIYFFALLKQIGVSQGDLFFSVLVFTGIGFFLTVGLIILLFKLRQQVIKPQILLNFVAVTLFPVLAANLLSIVMSFLYWPLVIYILVLGNLLGVLFLYQGISKLLQKDNHTVWYFAGVQFLIMIGMTLVLNKFILPEIFKDIAESFNLESIIQGLLW